MRYRAIHGDRGSTATHGRRQTLKALLQLRRQQKVHGPAQIRWRLSIKKDRRIGHKFVPFVALAEKTQNCEVVGQNANATRRTIGRLRQSRWLSFDRPQSA